MKLEPEMYVRINNDIRTICLGIGKIKKIVDDTIYVEMRDTLRLPVSFEIKNIYKASHNIIDLIEDDDIAIIEYYVSKYRQRITRMFECRLFKSKEDDFVIFENKHCDWWYDKNKKEWVRAKGYNPKIKSIVTKEQFESMSYKVGE